MEFLRYVVYKATGSTLLIKSAQAIDDIKNSRADVGGLFFKYQTRVGLEKLAQIFYRFKPIFLALKSADRSSATRTIINRIRKLATKHHQPMKPDFLNNITAQIKQGKTINKDELNAHLEKSTIFRKIRLLYALNYRLQKPKSVMYRIRNGKGFAKEFNVKHKKRIKSVYDIVLNSIVRDIKNSVDGKKIYLPPNVVYALPATEKMFSGDIPSGSYVKVKSDMIFGIHWMDTRRAIDLDLSAISVKNGKIGWDGVYRSANQDILFSGDVTAAPKPKGASELFYVKRNIDDVIVLNCNYFNYDADDPVNFKVLVAKGKPKAFNENHMVDPNKIQVITKLTMTRKQKICGILVSSEKCCKFYFIDTDLGSSVTSSATPWLEHARRHMIDYYTNAISLNEILVMAGADIVDEPSQADIDLSAENLQRDSIIKLITQ